MNVLACAAIYLSFGLASSFVVTFGDGSKLTSKGLLPFTLATLSWPLIWCMFTVTVCLGCFEFRGQEYRWWRRVSKKESVDEM